jgi:hypothetical protein
MKMLAVFALVVLPSLAFAEISVQNPFAAFAIRENAPTNPTATIVSSNTGLVFYILYYMQYHRHEEVLFGEHSRNRQLIVSTTSENKVALFLSLAKLLSLSDREIRERVREYERITGAPFAFKDIYSFSGRAATDPVAMMRQLPNDAITWTFIKHAMSDEEAKAVDFAARSIGYYLKPRGQFPTIYPMSRVSKIAWRCRSMLSRLFVSAENPSEKT